MIHRRGVKCRPDGANPIGTAFQRNTIITSFNEFAFFTVVTQTNAKGYGFMGCSSLRQITLPESLQKLNGYAFSECSSLVSLVLPPSVNEIGFSAVAHCSSMQWIKCLPTTPPALKSGSQFLNTTGYIYVPDSSVDAYKTAWTSYADKIKPLSEFKTE